jgi:hypothetical protein
MNVQSQKQLKVRIFKPKQKLQKSLPAFRREAFEFAGRGNLLNHQLFNGLPSSLFHFQKVDSFRMRREVDGESFGMIVARGNDGAVDI